GQAAPRRCCCDPWSTNERLAPLFFFQAEDGIRDATVTGVQTCALPISAAALSRRALLGATRPPPPALDATGRAAAPAPRARGARSEERRVGKECGWR